MVLDLAKANRAKGGRGLNLPLRERFIQHLFGYDFFISYRWSDARTYAVRLKETLVSRGLVVFLDDSDFAKGDNWREEGRRVLQRSSRLLLICSPDVHDSSAVLHEVEIFSHLARRILPIDIAGALRSRPSPLGGLIRPEVICFVEPTLDCLSRGPSEQIVDDIVKSFELIRQQVRRLRWLSAAVAVLSCALVVAIALGVYASSKRREADLRRLVAEGGRADATLNQPTEWATGLAVATAAAVSALRAHISPPQEVQFGLLRAVWSATPYRVLMRDGKDTARPVLATKSGRVLAIAQDGTVRLLDPRLASLQTLPLRQLNKTRLVALSDDESLVATVDATAVQVWHVDGRLVRAIPLDAVGVTTIAFTRDNQHLLTTDEQGVILSWPLDGNAADLVQQRGARILAAALSPVADLLAVVDDTPAARIVDWRTHQLHATLALDPKTSRLVSVAFSPDGARVVTTGQDETLEVWSTDTGERQVGSTRAHIGEVTGASFSPDGGRIASAGFDGTLRLWTPASGKTLRLFGHTGPVTSALFLAGGDRLVSSSEDGSIRVWDAPIVPRRPFVAIAGEMRAPCGHGVSRAGDRIVTVAPDGSVNVSDTSTASTVATYRPMSPRVSAASLSRDGSRLVVVTEGVDVAVLDASTGQPVRALRAAGKISAADFAPNGDRVVIAGKETAEVRSLDDTAAVALPHGAKTYGVAFSADGKLVATTGADGRIRSCGSAGSACIEMDAHSVYGQSVCFDGATHRLLSGGGDRLAKLWSSDGKPLLTFAGHIDAVSSAISSSDGRYAYTISDQDRAVRIWGMNDGARVGQLDLPDDATAIAELPGARLAISMARETWIGPTAIQPLVAEGCKILHPLKHIQGISETVLHELHADCDALFPGQLESAATR